MADETKEVATESLDNIFSAPEASPSQVKEETPTPEPTSTDKKDDDSSSSKTESEEKPTPSEKKEDSTDDSELPSKPETQEEKDAKAAASKKLDEDAAAEKKKVSEEEVTFKKRFEDTHKWGQELSQQNAQMRNLLDQQHKQLEILQKKVDGTWTDADDAKLQEGHTVNDVAEHAMLTGKAVASRASAIREFGPEAVAGNLKDFSQLFGSNAALQQAVRDAESPVHEVMAIMSRYSFEKEHGPDPKKWEESIVKKHSTKLEKELRKTILEEIKTGKKKAAETPESLATTSDSTGVSDKSKSESLPSLEKLFD